MELTVFKYAESDLALSAVFASEESTEKIPISFLFYMICVKNRCILVDVGCNEMPGFDMRRFIKPVDLLKCHGVDPHDITDVVITHADWDHMGAISDFAHARVYIQKDEYARAKQYFSLCTNIYAFDEVYELCDGIKIVKIGGHQIGSSVVEINLDSKIYVLAGDECYVSDCLKYRIPTGNSYNLSQSQYFIDHYSNEKYSVFLYHDASVMPGHIGAIKIINKEFDKIK